MPVGCLTVFAEIRPRLNNLDRGHCRIVCHRDLSLTLTLRLDSEDVESLAVRDGSLELGHP